MAVIRLGLRGADGILEVEAANAHEMIGVLEDPEFITLTLAIGRVEATGAPESDEEVLSEGEALEALKTALGASESPETGIESTVASESWTQGSTGDAKAAFLSKFGKGDK